jgi:hypothetical protein
MAGLSRPSTFSNVLSCIDRTNRHQRRFKRTSATSALPPIRRNDHPTGNPLLGAGAVHHIKNDIPHCGKTASIFAVSDGSGTGHPNR